MMELVRKLHAAALYITAVECAENAASFGQRQYMFGVRDAFEAVFRACYDVPGYVDAYTVARLRLELLSEQERVDLLTAASSIVYARRTETIVEDDEDLSQVKS